MKSFENKKSKKVDLKISKKLKIVLKKSFGPFLHLLRQDPVMNLLILRVFHPSTLSVHPSNTPTLPTLPLTSAVLPTVLSFES